MHSRDDKFSLLYVTGSLVLASSGPYHSLRGTGAELRARGHSLTVLGTVEHSKTIIDEEWKFATTVPLYEKGPASWHYAPELHRWLENTESRFDAVSIQNIWLASNLQVAWWAERKGLPYMITPHGSFTPVALSYSMVKKRIARFCLFENIFRRAACFQALNEAEYHSIRGYGIENPICIIPNGVAIPVNCPKADVAKLLPEIYREKKIVLFLGRLHPIKNLEGLLSAWSRIVEDFPEWRLVIAGDGDEPYKSKLKRLISSVEMKESVAFVGNVEGDTKSAWLSFASIFVLPSFSEGLPVAALEAMAAKTAVLLTASSNIPEIIEAGAGFLTEPSPEAIATNLRSMLSLTAAEIELMGQHANKFAATHYSWDRVCGELEEVYLWMRDGGSAPPTIRFK